MNVDIRYSWAGRRWPVAVHLVDNAHEAEAYTAKAERLMVKWGIDDAMLADRRRKQKKAAEKIVQVSVEMTGAYCRGETYLGFAVAAGLGNVRALKSNGRFNTMTQHVYLIGHESDVQRALTLLASLRLQATTARRVWWKGYDEKRHMSSNEKFLANRQFIISFAHAVEQRLVATRTTTQDEAQPGTALVLVDRSQKVDEWLGQKYPKLKEGRGVNGSYAGRDEGRAAGQRASLGGSALPGSKGQLR